MVEPHGRRALTADQLVIAVLVLAGHFGGLQDTPILDRDEARFAEATRDMRERGDAVVPHFNGEPRYHKPILIYWLQWGAMAVLGPTELAVRLPSVLCGAALAILVYELGRFLFGRRPGLLASLMTTAAPLVWIETRIGTADAALAASVAAAFLCRIRARSSSRPVLWRFGTGAALGAAVLAKGPVALAVLFLAQAAEALALLVQRDKEKARGEKREDTRGPGAATKAGAASSIAPTAAFLAVVLPWALLAGVRTDWAFWREGLGFHFASRLGQSHEGHRLFPGAHTLLLAVTCFPWSLWIPASGLFLWRKLREGDPRARFLFGWAIGPLVLFEAAASRLPHYTLPLLPAFALAAAWFIEERRAQKLAAPAVAMLAMAALLALGWAVTVQLRPEMRALATPCAWGLGSAIAAMALGGFLSLAVSARRGAVSGVAAGLGSWIVSMSLLGTFAAPRFPPLQTSLAVSGAIRTARRAAATGLPDGASGDTVFLVSYREPSLVFYLRRDLFRAPGQVVEAPVDEAAAKLTAANLAARSRPAWIVATDEEIAAIAARTGIAVHRAGEITGLNLSKGRQVLLQVARVPYP